MTLFSFFSTETQLTASQLILAELSLFRENGFDIVPHLVHLRTNPKNYEEITFPIFFCTHPSGHKVALFYPSRDIDDSQNAASKIFPYLLHTQEIARNYVKNGWTCIIPVTEHGPVQLASRSVSSRMHHVTLIWSATELKFFDPKSGTLLHLPKRVMGFDIGFDNAIFKDFSYNADYLPTATYDPYQKYVKEGYHPQDIYDVVNCGRYCISRIEKLIDHLLANATNPIATSGTAFSTEHQNNNAMLQDIKTKISAFLQDDYLAKHLGPTIRCFLQNDICSRIFAKEVERIKPEYTKLTMNQDKTIQDKDSKQVDFSVISLKSFALTQQTELPTKPQSLLDVEEENRIASANDSCSSDEDTEDAFAMTDSMML